MRALWTQEEASYNGTVSSLAPSWAYPKPAQSGGPPVLLGGGWGPKLMEHLCRWADGWMPISARPSLERRLQVMRDAAATHGRDPATLTVTVMGATEDPAGLENLGNEGVERAVLTIWQNEPDAVLRELDRLSKIVTQLQ